MSRHCRQSCRPVFAPPTRPNNQSYSIIVVKDRKLMKSVCGYQGGCMLVYCADYTRMKGQR